MNPLQRAFEDIGQRDFEGTELGPICIGVDPLTNKSIWHRERLPAADYATYSDGTPPDPFPKHENAGDRAERKTRELLAKPHATEFRAGPPGFFEFSMSGKLPPLASNTPEPNDVAHGLLDTIGLWAAYATALCVVGCVVFLFS